MKPVTDQELNETIRHALGTLGRKNVKPYRTHFCAGPDGRDREICGEAVSRGFMRFSHEMNEAPNTLHVFHVTPMGAEFVGETYPKQEASK